MDPLDKENFDNDMRTRETGFVDGYKAERIPLQSNSYLGECELNQTQVLIHKIWF